MGLEPKLKICSNCGNSYPETYENFYYKNKRRPELGFTAQCKWCLRARAVGWIHSHPAEKKAMDKKYQTTNRDRIVERRRPYYQKRNESGYMTQWRKDNQDKQREYHKNHHEHCISEKQYQRVLDEFGRSCAYCGMSEKEHIERFGKRLHRDHVDAFGSNGIENCVPACGPCNSSKRQYDMSKWYHKQPFFTEERLQRILWWVKEGYKEAIR